MRSRLYSALLLATAAALLICGAFVARTAHPATANFQSLLAQPGTPAIQAQYE
jgi:hypothetical protein